MQPPARQGRLRGTSNGAAVRCANIQAVLNALRDGEKYSAHHIGRMLGLHASTVARLMYGLEAAGLVRAEDDRREPTVGRPRKLWSLNRDRAYVVGLEVHPAALRGVLVDLAGQPILRRTSTYDPPLTADALVHAVTTLTESLTRGLPPEAILGVGAGMAGIVDPRAGVVRFSAGLLTEPGVGATDYPLRDQLERALPWPVFLANDANLGALALFHRQVRNRVLAPDASLFYVIMAVEGLWGFGSGLVVHGKPYEGANGAAGEVVHPHLLCVPPDWGDLPQSAIAGDATARAEMMEGLRPVLEHIAALILTLDTDCNVLGGTFAALGPPLLDTLGALITATPGAGKHVSHLPTARLMLDPLWPDTIAFGAAESVLESVFREPLAGAPGPLVRCVLEAASTDGFDGKTHTADARTTTPASLRRGS